MLMAKLLVFSAFVVAAAAAGLAAAASSLAALPTSAPTSPCGNKTVLVVMSSAAYIRLQNGKEQPTGFYVDELAIPGMALTAAGCRLVYANPLGNRPPMDPHSNQSKYFSSAEQWAEALAFVSKTSPPVLANNLNDPLLLSALAAWPESKLLATFDAVMVPGGHAPLVDLWNNPDLGVLLRTFRKASTLVTAICHGPVALAAAAVAAPGQDAPPSTWAFANANLTVFSTAADKMVEKRWGGRLPEPPGFPAVLLEQLGANVLDIKPGAPHVVEDPRFNLITGQNPYSAEPFGNAVLKALTT